MKKGDDIAEHSALRQKAEELLKKKMLKTGSLHSETDIMKLLHELEVYQIELEIQNDELLRAKGKAESAGRKYKELYDFAPTGYFTLSNDGKITDLNFTAAKMLGRERIFFKDKYFTLFLSEDTKPVFNLFFEKILHGETGETCDVILRSLNSEPLHAHLNGISLNNEKHCLISAADITVHKQVEAEKFETHRDVMYMEKLESISLLAGGIAHDFNNLLSVILSSLNYIEFFEKIENPVIKKHIANAREAVNSAADLTKQIMAYAGKAFYEISEFELNSLIRANSGLFRKIIPEHIRFDTELNGTKPLIKGDENQLKQVLMNLLINASEAIGDKNGLIKISTGNCLINEDEMKKNHLAGKPPPGKYVFIKITDTGCGIEKNLINKIFEPFFTTKFTGRGMGLSYVHGIITAHFGGIFIDSEKNHGTTITVLLPALDLQVVPEKITFKKNREKAINIRFNGTLIIAEDNPVLLKINSDILTMAGFKMLAADNGVEALDLFRANRGTVDGLILDLTMPEMGGVDTAKAVRKIDRDIPIIFISGYDPSDKSLGLDTVSYNAFIHKPVPIDELFETLASVFKDLII